MNNSPAGKSLKIVKLMESLSRGELSHALLLETPENSLAQLEPLFRSILCTRPGIGSCGQCESCKIPLDLEKLERHHPDFWVVQPENENAYSVEQVREWESRFLYLSKNIASRKLLVIPQAEKLNGTQNAAANALLKILEEPRSGTFLILLSSNTLRLISTIRSRCMKINLKLELQSSRGVGEQIESQSEVVQALWGKFPKDSELSNATWWKNKAERIAALESAVPQLWRSATSDLAAKSRDEALAFWARWKHFEDFLWAVRHYGNPGLHWLNFKRKVISNQPWRISKLFG
jgi:hypothetical protein